MVSSLNKKLDKILENQEKILNQEQKILKEENTIEKLEKEELEKEDEIEQDYSKHLDSIEKQLKKTSSPLTRLTKKDLVKGFIGSFIGVMSHFAFTKAADIALNIGVYRATLLYIIAFIIIVGMLYYSGFRQVRKKTVFHFVPLRASVLFGVSIITVIFINVLFGEIVLPISFIELYTIVSANIILAVIGAGTADLIGKVEE